MTIDQGIALATSIAACLSALAAFFTIRQVSKQRESSYHPELAVSRTKFQCISNPLSEGHIPDTWIDWTDEEEPGLPVITIDTFTQESFYCDECEKEYCTGDESMFVQEF